MKKKKFEKKKLPLLIGAVLMTIIYSIYLNDLESWTNNYRSKFHDLFASILISILSIRFGILIYKSESFEDFRIKNYDNLLSIIVSIILIIIFFKFMYQQENLVIQINAWNSKYYLEILIMIMFSVCSYYLLYQSSDIKTPVNADKSNVLHDPNLQISNTENTENTDIKFKVLSKEKIERIKDEFRECLPDDSIEDFKLFITNKKIDKKIIWYGGKRKARVEYIKLFHLMHLILEDGENKFKGTRRKEMLLSLLMNFKKEEDSEQKDLNYNSMNGAYTIFNLKKFEIY